MPPLNQQSTDAEIAACTVGQVELHDRSINLVEYDPAWPVLFERDASRIRAALGDAVLQLEHVGSTSVPGLAAKPQIDMLLVVEDSSDEAAYLSPIEQRGYSLHIREPNWHEHRLLKGPDTNINLHVFSRNCIEIERMLRFRDRLRSHPDDRQLYEETKRDLASRSWRHVQNYADAKTSIVEDILARATTDRP